MKFYKLSTVVVVLGFFVFWNRSHGFKSSSLEVNSFDELTKTGEVPVFSKNHTKPSDSQKEFRERLDQVLSEVPTIQGLDQYSDEDLHYGIPGLSKLGEDVGQIIDKMESNPELVPNGISFFRRCALNSSAVLSVRAVCLRNYLDWNNKRGQSEFPRDVQELAQKLPVSRR